ncbi:MAG: hypothetical protein U1E56_03530 [Bauldia sp.]
MAGDGGAPVDTAAALRPNCSRCAALCCVALAFDRSPEFAIDKANGVPCPHLDAALRCRIHDKRREAGFSGCVGYDCRGAGQRVTQEVFGGRSWQDDPALLPAMVRAFVKVRALHELLLLLAEAEKLGLSPAERLRCCELAIRLAPATGWTAETLALLDEDLLTREVRSFLAGLRERVARRSVGGEA